MLSRDFRPAILSRYLKKIWPPLKLCGLMTITKLYDHPAGARDDFKAMRGLRDQLIPNGEISMG